MKITAGIFYSLVIVACWSSLCSAGKKAEEKGLRTAALCYMKLLQFISAADDVFKDGDLNYNTVCATTQTYINCFSQTGTGGGFTLHGNRVLNWQMCKANKVLGLCPRAQCKNLKKKAKKTEYWKNLPFPASEGMKIDCAKDLHRKCNFMYLDSLKNHKPMTPYYQCYVDGYKSCPSRILAPLTQTYIEALTEGSPVNQMFKELRAAFIALIKQAQQAR